jgi:hypothetical protein
MSAEDAVGMPNDSEPPSEEQYEEIREQVRRNGRGLFPISSLKFLVRGLLTFTWFDSGSVPAHCQYCVHKK